MHRDHTKVATIGNCKIGGGNPILIQSMTNTKTEDVQATVAQILGLSSYNKIMTVRSLVNWVQFMMKEMDIPLSISQMEKISKEEYFAAIDRMADAALADGCTATNPRVPSKADIMKIYEALW